jgi:hypothetical protein
MAQSTLADILSLCRLKAPTGNQESPLQNHQQKGTKFVPAFSALTLSTAGLKKLNDMWLKHNEMVKELKVVRNKDICGLDDRDKETGKALREFVMDFKHSGMGKKLFHSPDKLQSYQERDLGTVTHFTAFPEHLHKTQAMSVILPALVTTKVSLKCT